MLSYRLTVIHSVTDNLFCEWSNEKLENWEIMSRELDFIELSTLRTSKR